MICTTDIGGGIRIRHHCHLRIRPRWVGCESTQNVRQQLLLDANESGDRTRFRRVPRSLICQFSKTKKGRADPTFKSYDIRHVNVLPRFLSSYTQDRFRIHKIDPSTYNFDLINTKGMRNGVTTGFGYGDELLGMGGV